MTIVAVLLTITTVSATARYGFKKIRRSNDRRMFREFLEL